MFELWLISCDQKEPPFKAKYSSMIDSAQVFWKKVKKIPVKGVQ